MTLTYGGPDKTDPDQLPYQSIKKKALELAFLNFNFAYQVLITNVADKITVIGQFNLFNEYRITL